MVGSLTSGGARAETILEIASGSDQFKTLTAAVQAAGLESTLAYDGLTVFAPTDAAFAKLPAGTVETLLKPENRSALQRVLMYHVVFGKVTAAQAMQASHARTLAEQRVSLSVKDGEVFVDEAQVVTADIMASNGVIHVIDSVILPEQRNLAQVASEAGSFNTLVAAVKAAGLLDAISGDQPLTVFAPTDEAFKALPKGTVEDLLKPENKQKLVSILTYHVVPGWVYSDQALALGKAKTLQGGEVTISTCARGVMVNEAVVVTPDIEAANGVIHAIDQVVLPK